MNENRGSYTQDPDSLDEPLNTHITKLITQARNASTALDSGKRKELKIDENK